MSFVNVLASAFLVSVLALFLLLWYLNTLEAKLKRTEQMYQQALSCLLDCRCSPELPNPQTPDQGIMRRIRSRLLHR